MKKQEGGAAKLFGRRDFLGMAAVTGVTAALGDGRTAGAGEKGRPAAGRVWPGWKTGEFQAHFIYTGRAESIFMILPDGTTLLVDSGDYDIPRRKERECPVLPNRSKGCGEWIARYVRRANPFGKDVDYWMLSHWHADHGGCETSYARREERDGDDWYVSGLAETIDHLSFGRGFDRCWPNTDDPFPLADGCCRELSQIARTYRYMERHFGFRIDKFKVGALNQVAMLKAPEKFPEFRIRNICGNGLIACRDGSVRNLYEGVFTPGYAGGWRNENGMSCGMMIEYGPFRFYTAGDFQDFWKNPDGTTFSTEREFAKELDRVDVAKTNHHGCDMDPAIIAALGARVWVSCVFAQHHNPPKVLEMLASRTLYPGPRVICPTVYPKKRRASDGDAPWTRDVCPSSFEPGHVVLSVAPGGGTYAVSRIDAADESMTVKSVMSFRSGDRA